MPVITISRQFAAAGQRLGHLLAERFGGELLDREILAAVAERAGIPESEAEGYDERLPGVWQRLATALAAGSTHPTLPPLPTELMPAVAFHERLAHLTQGVIEEAAARGNAIIVGRGGAFILAGRPDVVHVQLHAPLEARVRFLMSRVEEIPPDTRPDEPSLRELCRSVDARRAQYIRRLFDADWLDARHYDLSIDTSRVDHATAADIIERVARGRSAAPARPPTPAASAG